MIPIKIQCGCGQRYAFDVEPIHGRMPYAVTCPACGVDGTAAANDIIAQSLPVDTAAPPAPAKAPVVAVAPSVIRGSPTPTRPRQVTMLPWQMDRSQAKIEARARILWGEAPGQVVTFLITQGIPAPEASAIVDELFQERAATIRFKGISKMVIGSLLICIPIAAWVIFNIVGYILVKIFGFTIVVGFYGVWLVIQGAGMFFAPKSEPGDVADQ